MSLSPEEFNRLRGVGLGIRVMDAIRAMSAAGERITATTITKRLAAHNSLSEYQEESLYTRVKYAVINLERTGDISRAPEYDPLSNLTHKIITLNPTP